MMNEKHGGRYSAEYSSWRAMKYRCLNQKSKDFLRYGGAGITIAPEWIESFQAFVAHIGPRPKGTSLDRIDNDLGYAPGNVRWSTRSQQQLNKSTSVTWVVRGELFSTLQDAADKYGVKIQTIHKWVRGWKDERRNTFNKPKEGCYAIGKY